MHRLETSEKRNQRVLKLAAMVCVGAFLFGFALVPIYRIACVHVFGIKLDPNAANQAKVALFKEDDTRLVTVQFISNVNSALSWEFQPEVGSMEVHPGKLSEAWFYATNNAANAIVGNAVPSVAPNIASPYFNKTECFCFTEQLLNAGESRRMPVRFVVDPKLPADIHTLTLSYTFYNNELATQRMVRQSEAAKPAS